MYIPVRLPQNAYDLTRSAKEMGPPLAKATGRTDGVAQASQAPSFPPGLRDVTGELEQLLTRLAPNAQNQRSRAELGLSSAARSSLARASVLRSTAPLNPAASSYGQVELTFGGSTGVARLSGTYTGTGAAAGARSLTVALDANTTLDNTSPSPLAFHVTDQTGATVFSYSGSAKAGQAIDLGGELGLALTFSSGSLVAGEADSTSVARTVATDVNPAAHFGDADANLRPRFAGGATVQAGSFTVNGQRIEVTAEDSINSVLQRIVDRAPGLTASFANDRVQLATRGSSRDEIVLSDDTSGFLAATNLLGAATDKGVVGGLDQRLADTSRFANVQAGSFRLGGQLVAVDPQTDTLRALLARMNAVPGAAVYYDGDADQVVVRGNDEATTLADDSSGFLGAALLAGPREAPAREPLSLAPGTAARLQRGQEGQKGELLARTMAALDTASSAMSADDAGAAGLKGAAARARAAYGRQVVEARDARDKRAANKPATPTAPSKATPWPAPDTWPARETVAASALGAASSWIKDRLAGPATALSSLGGLPRLGESATDGVPALF